MMRFMPDATREKAVTGERRNRTDLLELFKLMKGLSSTPWSHFFQKGRRHFNQRAHLEIGEEALSLRFTFVLLFPEGHQ